MRANKVKRALKAGQVAIGTMIDEVRSPGIAQILASAGLDFFFVDMEHGAYDLAIAADIIRTARLEGICPLVRAPDSRYAPLGRILDIGALGLMVPRIGSRKQVEELVAETKYPPLGRRGCFITGAMNEYRGQATGSYMAEANEETLVIVQVELAEAVAEIDALLSVPGVDVAFLGPGDLSIDLGVPGQTDHPRVLQAIERVLEACRKHNVVPGIHLNSIEALAGWMHKGVRMVTWNTDIRVLLGTYTDGAARLRKEALALSGSAS